MDVDMCSDCVVYMRRYGDGIGLSAGACRAQLTTVGEAGNEMDILRNQAWV